MKSFHNGTYANQLSSIYDAYHLTPSVHIAAHYTRSPSTRIMGEHTLRVLRARGGLRRRGTLGVPVASR